MHQVNLLADNQTSYAASYKEIVTIKSSGKNQIIYFSWVIVRFKSRGTLLDSGSSLDSRKPQLRLPLDFVIIWDII